MFSLLEVTGRSVAAPGQYRSAMSTAALRVVFDTNVLLSLWVFEDSRFAPLRDRVDAGDWLALTRDDCLAEFRRVLGYPAFALDAARQAAIHADYAATARCEPAGPASAVAVPRCQDRDDQKFLELARDAGADWLVSADKALLKLAGRCQRAGLFRILSPDAALAELQAEVAMPANSKPFALSLSKGGDIVAAAQDKPFDPAQNGLRQAQPERVLTEGIGPSSPATAPCIFPHPSQASPACSPA